MANVKEATPHRIRRLNCIEARSVPGHENCRYFFYRPLNMQKFGTLLVSVHGITRNALEHAARFKIWADQLGVAVVAPLFDKKYFNQYQTLRQTEGAPAPDEALKMIVTDAFAALSVQDGKMMLFGYSGGGQFAHRFALKHPDSIGRLVIGAAGWYTYPDTDIPYPQGLGGHNADAPFAHSSILAKYPRTLVAVGSNDDLRDGSLNKSRMIDRQQGTNRLSRGLNWCTAMNASARRQGLDPICRFIEIPATGHDFSACMQSGLDRVVIEYLFSD